jgi:hypothetical protein
MMKPTLVLISAAVIATLVAPGIANATIEKFNFSGSFDGGTLIGSLVLDVDSTGFASSGTAAISGPGLPGVETLGLVPVGDTYEAGDGTDLFGQDNMWPIDASGFTFGTNAPGSLTGGYVFGFELGGEVSGCAQTDVCGFVAGPGGPGNLYNATEALTFTQTAAPEPSTWAMMLVGFAGLGYAGYRAQRKSATASGVVPA